MVFVVFGLWIVRIASKDKDKEFLPFLPAGLIILFIGLFLLFWFLYAFISNL
ncbi:hypothetical protein Arcve_0153 [Archaeoglobus veneficus SNP6]|uniref:Uncharacterized protein n=1 Tax=Archaeoglobus veneficus (strain DSM 11195 / SNP6) TaxID=693661 RepID=F2KN93_ARCVS|nr:hypothetical protein Arcve_0153 [Archaeoglobus veneficus SNP6]